MPTDDPSDVYRAYGWRVYRYCLFRCGSREDAEDITVEVFVRLLRARHPSGEEVLPWLLHVAGNLCTDHQRRARRGRAAEGRAPVPSSVVEISWPDPTLHEALAALPDAQRQAVWLHAVEDLTFERVGRVMRRRTGAAKMLYYRGVRAVRARLEAVPDED